MSCGLLHMTLIVSEKCFGRKPVNIAVDKKLTWQLTLTEITNGLSISIEGVSQIISQGNQENRCFFFGTWFASVSLQ